jgi:hypothetical protein
VTTVDGRLLQPLRSGSRLVVVGMLIVLLALLLDPTSRLSWVANLAGVGASTWGAIRVTTWLAKLRGRRSLTETAVGIGLTGAAAAMTITTAQGPQDRENSWMLAMSAISFALLGVALIASAAFDHRGEQRLMDNPPEPREGAISKPQHPGTPLRSHESQFLRLTVAVTAACYLAVTAVSFLR